MKFIGIAFWLLLVSISSFGADRPNILWITCEDISPYLGSYGCKEAKTPNLDQLATEGIRYTQAYANGPVCAVARSTLLSGMYASSIGTHHMRSNVQLPETIPAYPKNFRKAGYYCTNNGKEDYNSNYNRNPTVWNESSKKAHYKNRKAGQPFFAVFNFITTHESRLSTSMINGFVKKKQIPEEPRINPSEIILPPFHPDLPEIRQDWARLHDLITLMDEQVGELLLDLEESGLAEDTIVFFYSDHGGQLSRMKRYIYNVGTQVPLIIRVPEKWQHLVSSKPGSVCNSLVSFVDLPKTALALADLPIPEQMQGRIFLGSHTEPVPSTVHFYRDGMGDRFDFSRAVTDGRYYFIRNFMPHRPRGRDLRYGFTMQANWRAWEKHFDAGKCDPIASQFFNPKPLKQFFDTQKDPWHVSNLAGQKAHQERLRKLEKDLDQWMVQTRDIGLIPAPLFYDLAGPDKEHKTLYEYAQSADYPVERLLKIAKMASMGDAEKLPEYLKLIQDENPVARYWGAYGVFLVRSSSVPVQQALKQMIANDPLGGNRVMAAQALGLCGDPDTAFKAIDHEAKETQLGYVFMQALNAFQYSHTDDRLTLDDWKSFQKKPKKGIRGVDTTGFGYAQRLVKDAIDLWPARRQVD